MWTLHIHSRGYTLPAVIGSIRVRTVYYFPRPALVRRVKGIVHPKIIIVIIYSPLSHYKSVCISSAEHRCFNECWEPGNIGDFHCMNEKNKTKKQICCIICCSTEQIKSWRLGTTRVWENDDRIYILGWIISLMICHSCWICILCL